MMYCLVVHVGLQLYKPWNTVFSFIYITVEVALAVKLFTVRTKGQYFYIYHIRQNMKLPLAYYVLQITSVLHFSTALNIGLNGIHLKMTTYDVSNQIPKFTAHIIKM